MSFALTPGISEAKQSAWSRARKASRGAAKAIGGYSKGCVAGASKLHARGPGFTLMKPQRRRYYGHPHLIRYIKKIAKVLKKKGAGPILVGDLGQPMGGPSPSGHASHQSGLDVDLWFWHPKSSENRALSNEERRTLSAKDVVNRKTKEFTAEWNTDVATFLEVAAGQAHVSRIFVNPLIKKRLCEKAELSEKVLRKIRPWYGHADHMHVRLKCPKNSPHCKNQNALPKGDGCDQLDWWFDEEAQAARAESRSKYQKKVGAVPKLHAQCLKLIAPQK